jgi:uncharacterized membrane protein YoaK (UPF0700 family)
MTPARALFAGLLLTGTAGFVDAIGFITLGGYYTSFMSGNTTQLGAELANGAFHAVALPAALVALFFAGSVAGSLIALRSRQWGPSATLGLVVLGLVLTIAMRVANIPAVLAMLPLAFSAGAQNAVLQPLGSARLGATFVTGTLYAAGQDLARALTGDAPAWRWLQHLMVWTALCAGALVGAVAFGLWAADALVVPAVIYLLAMTWFTAVRPRA